MPKWKDVLFGKKAKTKKLKKTTKEQDVITEAINKGLLEGKGPIADIFAKPELQKTVNYQPGKFEGPQRKPFEDTYQPYNEEAFNKGVAEPTIKNFKENILPGIQNKFISNNATLGSSFQKAQAKAGTDLQSQLNQLRYGAQQEAQGNLYKQNVQKQQFDADEIMQQLKAHELQQQGELKAGELNLARKNSNQNQFNQQNANRLTGINQALGVNGIENVYQPGSEGLVQGAVKAGVGAAANKYLPG